MKKVIFFYTAFAAFLYPADYSIILDRNIFAPAKDVSQQQEETQQVLPVIKLPELDELLELKGTFISKESADDKKNFAIMENKKTKETDFYRVGDKPESALIVDIEKNRVVFEYGFEKIELTKAGSAPVKVYPDAEYRIELKNLIEEIKKTAVKPFPITSKPAVEDGIVKGYILQNIPEGSILRRYGIKDNDVIMRINTIPLDSPEKPLYAYENILKYGIKRITVELLRDNLPYIFIYNLY